MKTDHMQTVVIGGSQAGLAVGYHLRRRGLPFVIVDENKRVGDAWRNRWDTLRLFTPARYSGLPGMPFPGPASAYPTKDETANYLEKYAREFGLPVRTGVKVDRLSAAGDHFEAFCGDEVLSAYTPSLLHRRLSPSQSSGLCQRARRGHDPAALQQLPQPLPNLRKGAVLVVGAGNSGAEIAMELAGDHRTWLSGPDRGQRAYPRLEHLLPLGDAAISSVPRG